jgi:hypothetical protein
MFNPTKNHYTGYALVLQVSFIRGRMGMLNNTPLKSMSYKAIF